MCFGLVCAASLMTLVDTEARQSWYEVRRGEHVVAVLAIMMAVGGVASAIGSLPVLTAIMLRRALPRGWVTVLLSVTAALVAVGLAHGPVQTTLSGMAERAPDTAARLNGGLLGLIGAGAIGMTTAVHLATRRGRGVVPMIVGGVLVGAGGAIAWADATVLVALYAGAHELAEVTAWVVTTAGAGLLAWGGVLGRRRVGVALRVLAAGVALWTAFFALSASTRADVVERKLAHVWREPGQATRMCLRLQLLEGYLRDPSAWRGKADARMRRLIERYDVASVKQSPAWDLPAASEPGAAAARAPLNVVVVFVDTLRADTAADPSVMPRLHALREQSLSFTQAYAAASDTVSSLPVLTGGCFGASPCPADALAWANRRGIPTGLVIAKSARRFLGKHAPHFTFSDVTEIVDYEEGKKVWGYGADGSTADQVTEDALKWMAAHRDEQFLLWAFHFDVHNWMHLDPGRFNSSATQYAAAHGQADRYSRYNTASAGVDAAIGGLVDGLARLGLEERTAVLVVSDHGEALGQRGHAFHAVYLWNSLVHIPLVLRVPGVEPRAVEAPTGHVDIAPTIVSLLEPAADLRDYHGVSLLAADEARDRALPLLMFSMRRDELLRVGIVGRRAPYFKLEIPFDSVEPELYDLTAAMPDAVDVSRHERSAALGLLSSLVTSPVFPRGEADAP